MSATLAETAAWRNGAAAADVPRATAQSAAAANGITPEASTASQAAPDPEPRPTAAPAEGSRMALAIAALEASRGLLRHEMLPPAMDYGPRARHAAGSATWLRPWRRLRRWLRRWPAADIATGAVHDWWRAHPLRPVADVLAAQWRDHAVPVVRRHPVLTVTAAATLGALVVTTRPWRWPLVAREIEPLPSRVGHWLVAQLSSVPVQTALAALAVMAAQPSNPPAPGPGLAPATQVKPETAVDTAGTRPAPSDDGAP